MAESTRAYSPIDPASLLERVVYRRDRITCAKRTLVKIASSRSGAHRLRIDRTRTRFHEDPARACPVARIIGSGFASFWLVGWRPPTASSWVEGRHCRDCWGPTGNHIEPSFRTASRPAAHADRSGTPTSVFAELRYLCFVIWTSGLTLVH